MHSWSTARCSRHSYTTDLLPLHRTLNQGLAVATQVPVATQVVEGWRHRAQTVRIGPGGRRHLTPNVSR